MEMKSVFSSHISKIGYDSNAEELHVEFQNGKTAVYQGVPGDVAAKVTGADSIGKALHEHIKGQYAHGYKPTVK